MEPSGSEEQKRKLKRLAKEIAKVERWRQQEVPADEREREQQQREWQQLQRLVFQPGRSEGAYFFYFLKSANQ